MVHVVENCTVNSHILSNGEGGGGEVQVRRATKSVVWEPLSSFCITDCNPPAVLLHSKFNFIRILVK